MLFERIRSAHGKGDRVKSRDATIYLHRVLCVIGIEKSPKFQKLCYCSAVLIWLGTMMLSVGFVLSWALEMHRLEMNVLLFSVQTGLDAMGLVCKMLIVACMHERLQRTEQIMDVLDARCTEPEERDEIRKIALFGNRIYFTLTALYFVNACWSFFAKLWSRTPLYSIYNPVWDWRDGQRELLAHILLEGFGLYTASFPVPTADIYPVIYISIIRMHLKFLGARIQRLGSDAKEIEPEKRIDEFVQCILDHMHILEIFDLISPIISRTIFVQLVLTGCILGVSMFNIVLFQDVSNVVATLIYILCVMMQTLPTAYCADAVRLDCDELARAIFHSKWTDQDARLKKLLLFFMLRVQKPMDMMALKLFPISIASNANMIKFAFSIFTLMNKMDFGKTMLK